MGLDNRILDILIEWANSMSEEMRESLLKHKHTDSAGSGDLYQAATIKPEWVTAEGQNQFRLKIVLPYYAEYLNDGTRPSAKNPSPSFINSLSGATSWISRKGIGLPLKREITLSSGKKGIVTYKNKAEANRSFAWAIARHRLKYGSKGSGWFDEVWGGYPVPENSEATKKLQTLLLELAGDAQFFVDIITDENSTTI